jgi:predicted nucleic acid-binding protein
MAGILLDTNVLSELMRPHPAVEVIAWFARRPGQTFLVSAVTRAEMLLGIALLPNGQRRDRLAQAAEAMFAEDFSGHSLPFDDASATAYALLVAERSRQGLTTTTEDGQIAAIALSQGLPLATRNVKDFIGISGLIVINPWTAE